jgi:hypothetical protein
MIIRSRLFRSLATALVAVPLSVLALNPSPASATATGCYGNPGSSGSTCITVNGSGLRVDSVKATLTKNHLGSGCYRVTITFGSTYSIAATRCGDGRTRVYGPDPVLMSFPNGTRACASWSYNPSIRPCVTIHS